MANETNNVRLVLEAVNRTNENFDQVLALMRQVVSMAQTVTAANQSIATSSANVASQNAKVAASYAQNNAAQRQFLVTAQAQVAAMKAQAAAQQQVTTTTKEMGSSYINLRSILATIGAIEFVRGLIEANISLQRITNSLEAVAGRGEPARQEFAYLRREAERLGLQLPVIAQEYTKILAAGKPLGFSTAQIRDIFESVTEASVVLGLSMDDVHGTLRAVQQMMSKGTVQAEELRGQLGERLPGAVSLMAKGLGVTTAELGKMLEQGQVLAKDALPALAKALRETYGSQVSDATQTTARAIDRLKNSYFELQTTINNSGFIATAINTLASLTDVLKRLTETLDGGAGGIIVNMAAAIAIMGGMALVAAKLAPIIGGLTLAISGVNLAVLGLALAPIAAITVAIGLYLQASAAAEEYARSINAVLKGLESQAKAVSSLKDVELTRRQILVQIAALNRATLEGDKTAFAIAQKYREILFELETSGVIQAALREQEALRTEEINRQTKKLDEQVKVAKKLADSLESVAQRYRQATLENLPNGLKKLQELLNDRNALRAKIPGLEDKATQATLNVGKLNPNLDPDLHEKLTVLRDAANAELLKVKTEELTLNKQVLDTEKAITEEAEKQAAARAKIARDKQTASEQERQIDRLRGQFDAEEKLAGLRDIRSRVDANTIIFEQDRQRLRIQLLEAERQQVERLIAVKKGDLTTAANAPTLNTSDELQKVQALASLKRDINTLEKERTNILIEQQAQQTTLFGTIQQSLVGWVNQLGTTAQQVAGILVNTLSTAIQVVSSNIADAIIGTQTWGEAFNNIALSIVKGLIQMVIQFGLQQAAMFVIRQVYGKASLAATAAEATAAAAMWAPAATAASIATFGGAALAGTAAFVGALAVGTAASTAFAAASGALGGARKGGYTGAGDKDDIAGAVHRREFVFPADVVDQVGPDALFRLMQGIRSGGAAEGLNRVNSRQSFTPTGPVVPQVSVTSSPAKVVLFHDRRAMEEYLRSPEGRDAVLHHVDTGKHALGLKS